MNAQSNMKRLRRLFAVAVACLIACGANAQVPDPVAQARDLLGQSRARAAYDLLKPHEAKRSGEPEFDYLLGVAALDIGQATEAVFALERVLAVNPQHPQARAEIARAYYALGERDAAKREFDAVRAQGVPGEVTRTIERFMSAIEQQAASERPRVWGFLEATLGHDTNVNSGVASASVAVPLFAGAVLNINPAGLKVSDNFLSGSGGLSFQYPLNPRVSVIGGLSLSKRTNVTQDTFDTGYWDGNLGVSYRIDKNAYTLAAQANQFYVDNNRYRSAYGAVGQWQHNFDARNQFSAYLQYSELSYPGQAVRDADRYVFGVGYAHAYRGGQVAYVGAYAGAEDERTGGVEHLGFRLAGLRAGGSLPLGDTVSAFVNASVEQRRHGGADPFFLVTRDDTQSNLGLGLNWTPARNWKVTPQVMLTHNRSNVTINDFRRDVYSVTVRRDF